MPGRERIPEETKATIRALKSTTTLALEEIALRCRISRTSVQHIASTEEYGGKDLKASHKGVWQKAVNLEWEEKWPSSW